MEVKLPKLGEGADGGSVVSVLVKEGDRVTKGQTILELENEKAVAPIPSTASGVVSKISVKEGERITVGQVILTVDEDGGAETAPPAPPAAAAPAKSGPAPEKKEAAAEDKSGEKAEPAPSAPPSNLPPAASPSLRRIARDLGIDLTRIKGGERGGRIVMADLRAYIGQLQKLAAQPKAVQASAPSAPVVESIDFSKWGAVTKKPMTPLRKTIAGRMAQNWNAIPHVTQFDEADITGLTELRKKFVAVYEAKGAKLTLTSFALKAVVATLRKHSIFNASLDEAASEIVLKEYFHIGLAVDTEHGLFVPVIRDVDKKSLLQLSSEVADLAVKARERKLGLDEMSGGTFTISNQGGIGGAHFTPIVNKPEVAILGLGRAALKPVVKERQIEQRLMLPICVSYDHRVIDGGIAARFTVDLLHEFESFTENDLKL